MTPEAVIFRYLEVLRNQPVDRAQLQRLLCLDADLLGRWLATLRCAANPLDFESSLAELDESELKVLAQAHAWSLLPTLGTARLAMDQWQLVNVGAYLGEALAAHLIRSGWQSPSIADPLRVRIQVLLAISGVNLPHDPALCELADFRGTPVKLLIDADPLPQIFAVVEAMETQGLKDAAELAQTLLEIPGETFTALRSKAESTCSAELTELALAEDDNVEWGERLWAQQRMWLLAQLMPTGDGAADRLAEVHAKICRALFGHEAELFLADGSSHWRSTRDSSIRIRRNSPVSAIAQAGRDGASRSMENDRSLPVADRQVMRRLGVDEALVLPVFADTATEHNVVGVLVFPADDEVEPDYTMRAYADAVASWATRSAGGSSDELSGEDQLAAFRKAEHQRLRELVHEANNPLSIVRNYLHILEIRLHEEPEAREQLSMINHELQRAAGIIAQMRHVPEAFSQRATDVEVSISAIDLNALVRTVAELSSGFADSKDIELERWLSLGELTIESDPDLIMQVLTNLVKNALEACEDGDTVSIATHASVVRDGQIGVEIVVQDSGPGLPASVLATLWEEKRSTKGGDHQGLGLSLVNRLMGALGGHVDVRTSPESGTAFRLFLPRERTGHQGSK